jgi:hypothetical protein
MTRNDYSHLKALMLSMLVVGVVGCIPRDVEADVKEKATNNSLSTLSAAMANTVDAQSKRNAPSQETKQQQAAVPASNQSAKGPKQNSQTAKQQVNRLAVKCERFGGVGYARSNVKCPTASSRSRLPSKTQAKPSTATAPPKQKKSLSAATESELRAMCNAKNMDACIELTERYQHFNMTPIPSYNYSN